MAEDLVQDGRVALYEAIEAEFNYKPDIYRAGERFEDLPSDIAPLIFIDVTKVPGCHYGVGNLFLEIMKVIESEGVPVNRQRIQVRPENTYVVEGSTGNGWVAAARTAVRLGYKFIGVMPDGMPAARYQYEGFSNIVCFDSHNPDDILEQKKLCASIDLAFSPGISVVIVKTPADQYALGMPRQIKAFLSQNRSRLEEEHRIYVSPDHSVQNAEITVKAMSKIGEEVVNSLGKQNLPTIVVASMGNGASVCALENTGMALVVTESLNTGLWYDQFAALHDLESYNTRFGIDPANPSLMQKFITYGTNAPLEVLLPLQQRALQTVSGCVLFTESETLETFLRLGLENTYLQRVLQLPNYSLLPPVLQAAFGNSSLANIAVAKRFIEMGKEAAVMIYDGRENYID